MNNNKPVNKIDDEIIDGYNMYSNNPLKKTNNERQKPKPNQKLSSRLYEFFVTDKKSHYLDVYGGEYDPLGGKDGILDKKIQEIKNRILIQETTQDIKNKTFKNFL